jgi:predicted metal-dependent HD superfamily phosphohydrolase
MLSETRWQSLWLELGSAAPASSFAELSDAYGAAGRHYHGSAHIEACLGHLQRWQHLARDPALVELALWTHDLVYDTRRQDNEAASAERACQWLEQAGLGQRAPALREMILATRHQEAPTDNDAALVVDIDLSILGSEAAVYTGYETAVRAEYAWVPEPLFRAGRAKLLRQLLAMPALYHHATLAALWEAPARHNLAAALAKLETSPSR